MVVQTRLLTIRVRVTLVVVVTFGILIALMVLFQFRTSLSRIVDLEQEEACVPDAASV